MNDERDAELRRRVALHAALADPARLRVVDALSLGDASPSELAEVVGTASNLLAHHLKVLEQAGLVVRTRSEGDGRRTYVRLVPGALDGLVATGNRQVPRVLFVCTANSARSHLASALWRRASDIPTASAGTHPAARIAPGAHDVARRHRLDLPLVEPRHVGEIHRRGDLVVTVCDRAHEELDLPVDLHWSVPDPLLAGTPDAFDLAFEDLERRVGELAPRLTPLTRPTWAVATAPAS